VVQTAKHYICSGWLTMFSKDNSCFPLQVIQLLYMYTRDKSSIKRHDGWIS